MESDGRGPRSSQSERARGRTPARPGPNRRARDAPRGRPAAQLTRGPWTPRPAGQATMAGKAAAPSTAVLLVTANVGSLFDDVSATAARDPAPDSEPRPRALEPRTPARF